MDWKEFTAKSVDEALTAAMLELGTTADNLEYEVIEKETSGFLGIFGKPAKIRVRIKLSIENVAKQFLDKVFSAMGISAKTEVVFDKENAIIEINVEGDEMGVLIGKRGQTLDSLQYLVSLVVNKNSENYIKVKLDTENYRERRKETLENLAKNIAFKVKRTRKPVVLEPMNPYERRIIHSALQNDKYVETYSEGEEPYRKVVINIKKTMRDVKENSNYNRNNKGFHKELNKDFNNSEPIEVDFNIEVLIKMDKDSLNAMLTNIAHVFPEAKKKNYPFILDVSMTGFFSGEGLMDHKEFLKFCKINGTTILFPFLRATIADITRAANIEPFILPVVNIHNLIKDMDKEDNGETAIATIKN
jgi:spoIIIJ-associated protein